MSSDKLRRQLAWEAARLMYSREESEYFRAKMKAARRVCLSDVKPCHLPSNREIRDQIEVMARMYEDADGRVRPLQEMRLAALRIMRILAPFRPRLIGSVNTGHVRRGSDIDIHVFSDSIEAVCSRLDDQAIVYDVERKQVRKNNEQRTFVHIHFHDRFPFELTLYPSNQAHYVFKSSITGKAIERSSIAELKQMLAEAYPDVSLDQEDLEAESQVDRGMMFELLLLPLEKVKENPKYHPEGDALYHSLQVFDLARDEQPYDIEFLEAALLHDVGKAIDRTDHVAAGLEALEDLITDRTAWFIRHHMDAQRLRDGTLGARARKRLAASEDSELLDQLAQCDRSGRQCGVEVPDIEEVVEYLRELERM